MRWYQRRSKPVSNEARALLGLRSQSFTNEPALQDMNDTDHHIMARTESVMTMGATQPKIIVHGYDCACGETFSELEEAKDHMEFHMVPVAPKDLENVVRSLKSIEKDLA